MNKELQNIKVSIVIPVYMVSAYVERCVRSVMNQRYSYLECIIVDDCSPDDSIAKCERMISTYEGHVSFRILHHDKNRGLSAARNTGTDAATGEYIYYLDSDDEITKDCIEKLMEPIKRDDSIEMVMGNFMYDFSMMPKKNRQNELYPRFMEDTPLEIHANEKIREWFFHGKTKRPVSVWNKILRLSFVKTNRLYNREGILFEDNLWTLQLLQCLNHAAFVPDVTYIYCKHLGSIITSTKEKERILHFGKIHREIAEHIEPHKQKYETYIWLRNFCHLYVDASENPDYQYAYEVYRQKLTNSRRWLALCALTVVRCLAKSSAGRSLFKGMLRARLIVQKTI